MLSPKKELLQKIASGKFTVTKKGGKFVLKKASTNTKIEKSKSRRASNTLSGFVSDAAIYKTALAFFDRLLLDKKQGNSEYSYITNLGALADEFIMGVETEVSLNGLEWLSDCPSCQSFVHDKHLQQSEILIYELEYALGDPVIKAAKKWWSEHGEEFVNL